MEKNTPLNMINILKNPAVKIGLIAVASALLLGAGYFGLRKFLADRQRMMAFSSYRPRLETAPRNSREVRTYTQKELDEMRKKGTLPSNLKQPYVPPAATTAGQDAVQRSLKTLDEINRINEMNRRLQEQQQRRQ